MTRREILSTAASACAWLSAQSVNSQSSRPRLGGAPTAFSLRMRAARQENKPFDFVEYCHGLGLGGVETTLPKDADGVRKMRHQVETYGMQLYLNTPLPRAEGDVDGFDTAVKACKEAGARGLHAAMTGRRYEQFDSLDAFRKNFEQCQRSVALAEPILRKNKLKLAVENHKGWRAAEQAAWMKRVGSEWVGVCFDFGNNLSLSEAPDETFRLLAPYAIFSHIKDMGLELYEDGYLLSEVPFGQGVLNLRQMVHGLREKDPNMLFCLEMITRDPLKVPVFTDKYWATFDDSYSPVPARDLAKVLEIVRKNPRKTPLPRMAGLSPADQVRAEDGYNLKCIAYAHQNLDL